MSALYIGRVETVIGSCTLARADDATIHIRAGDPICPGDVIETAAGGRVGIRFTDGTVFNLSDRARMVMTEFAFGGDQPFARFDVTNGTFAFIAGEMAKIGRLGINTPFGMIRGRSGAGGVGALSLASLFLAAMQDVEAASNEELRMDDGAINFTETQEYKDLPYGIIELIIPGTSTEPERRLLLDNPDQEIVLRKVGNSTAVNYAQLNLSDLLRNYDAQKDAWHVYSLGQSGPTAFGNGGSGGALSLPPEFQPDQPFQFGPKFGGGPQGSLDPLVSGHGAGFDPIVQPPPPPPQPDSNSITANPDASAVGNVLTNDTLVGFGTLTVTNIQDSNENLAVTAGTTSTNGTVIHGLFGTLTIGADGSYTYVVDTSNPAVKALGAAQSVSDSFTYTATNGLTSAQTTLTVTVVGINDVPAIGGGHTGSVTEDVAVNAAGNLTTNGTLTITDVDQGQSNFTPQAGTTGSNGFGIFTLTADGTWTYTANNSQAAIQQLGAGQPPITDSFTAVSSDGTNSQIVTVTINGTNDAPVLSNVAPAAAYPENSPPVALSPGTVTITDIDNQTLASATVTITDFVAGDVLVFTNNNSTTYGNITTASSSNGVLSLTSAGNTATLAQWQAALDAVTYSSTSDNPTTFGTDTTRSITWAVSDGSLNSNTQTTTLTITAVNDAAVVSGKISGSVVEAGSGTPGTPTATGTLTDTDVDNPANTFTPVAAGTSSANGYGTYQMTAAGVWTYTLNNSNSTVNALNNGQSLTDTFTVTTVDGTPQPVTIAINGTTDAPFALDLPGLDALQGNGLNKFKTMGTFAGGFTYSLGAGSDAGFAVSTGGVLSTTQLNGSQNIGSGIYTLNVIATDQFGISHTIVTKIWVGTTSGSDIIDLATLGNSSGVNLAYGLNGEDKITGGGGFDFMIGGQQPDTLTAGSGSETFAASGNDTIVFNGLSFSDDIIYLLTPTDQIDLKSLPFVSGSMSATATFNGTVTSLVVSNGTTNVTLTLGGDYSSSTWQFAKDAGTGTIFHDPPADSGTATTTPELAGASPASMLTTDPDTVSFISGTNQVIGTDTTATNGDILTGGAGTDTLTIDTGPGISHTYAFGDGASGHSDIGLNKFENLTLTDQNADANNEATITVTFNSDFQNNGALTVDGSALHDLNGTNLTVDAYLAAHDSFTFIGSAGADTLIGGPQNDTFIGGGGGDTMKGGGGSDTFVFKATTDSQPGTGNFDTITDFIAGSDRIDLSAIVGASHVQGLVGTANTVAANSISWFADGAHNETIVYVNTSGAANHVDMEIHLAGANINLSGADILHS